MYSEAIAPAGGFTPPITGPDPFDPLRRFEETRPALGVRLGAVLTMPVDQAGAALLAIVEECFAATPLAVPARALAAARAVLSP